ncbi:MAG: hypothetical protein GXO48_00565 [Chlorobi bacterium]|nr:hypothetical protein [Chlorobiota bacterium]
MDSAKEANKQEKILLLPHNKVEFALKRMAHQIIERHIKDSVLTLIGIEPRGVLVARRLSQLITAFSDLSVEVLKINVDKQTGQVISTLPEEKVKGKTPIVVDDVLFTGKTLFSATCFVNTLSPEGIETAVLISRNMHKFPISGDYVGFDLSTTFHDYVEVVPEAGGFQVYILKAG